jgi:hypothetical protein
MQETEKDKGARPFILGVEASAPGHLPVASLPPPACPVPWDNTDLPWEEAARKAREEERLEKIRLDGTPMHMSLSQARSSLSVPTALAYPSPWS